MVIFDTTYKAISLYEFEQFYIEIEKFKTRFQELLLYIRQLRPSVGKTIFHDSGKKTNKEVSF